MAAESLLPFSAARAEPSIADLLQRLEAQEQKILALERKLEVKEEAHKSVTASAAVAKASPRGFSIQSADAKNQVKLRGVLHFDGRNLTNDDPNDVNDTWQATRIRPIVEGTVGGIYDCRFTPDFGQGRTVIQDAYVTGRFNPSFQVTAGKFKAPVGGKLMDSRVTAAYSTRSTGDSKLAGWSVAANSIPRARDPAPCRAPPGAAWRRCVRCPKSSSTRATRSSSSGPPAGR